MLEYKPMEMAVVATARLLEDRCMIVVGTGIPCAAAMLAQKTTAPNIVLLFEAGGVDPRLNRLPVSVGDSCTAYRAALAGTMDEIMEACQRGQVRYALLGGAQIDHFGNLNSTMIGSDYRKPKVRLPGSGGANDLASLCWRTIILMPHENRKFTDDLDFITTPGYLDGPGARERAGLPPGCGPYRVVTNLCVLGFHPESKRMQVEMLYPGVTRQEVEEATGFQLIFHDKVETAEPPTPEELRILREEVDPDGLFTG